MTRTEKLEAIAHLAKKLLADLDVIGEELEDIDAYDAMDKISIVLSDKTADELREALEGL